MALASSMRPSQSWVILAESAAAGMTEMKQRNKHVDAAMTGFSDVGSNPTVSTFAMPSDVSRRAFFDPKGVRMKYRMYIDEVGNSDLESSDNPNHRFLSLTGVIISLDYVRDILFPEMERLKEKHFGSHPDDPIILHRKESIISSIFCFFL